jgi:4-amino-4-deoxy-L-arabinose transferase-like glycosyltransferase
MSMIEMSPTRTGRYGGWRGLFHATCATHLRAFAVLAVIALGFFMPGFSSLQPMDRDEPRFAQATKQMLETRDFVDIRFQEEARHKKPVGIYWVQAAAVSLGEKLGVPEARTQIWLYRLPSLLGAVAMVLLTYWAGLAFLSREGAFLAGVMMAASILLGVEARLAKTDALLGALSVATFGLMARAYLAARAPGIARGLGQGQIFSLWIVLGFAVLVKGPITPLILALTAFVLVLRDRDAGWLRALRPGLGAGIIALIVLPWLSLILMKAGFSFIEDSLINDMLAKAASGQERHGAPPGTYLAVFWLTFWPAAPLVLLAIPFAWQERRDDGVAFLLAWIVPFWLVLEAVPTKLPHYVLPLYPALAILAMLAIERRGLMIGRGLLRLAAVLLGLVPLIFLVGGPALFLLLEEGAPFSRLPYFALPFLIAASVLGGLASLWMLRGRVVRAFMPASIACLALVIGVYVFGMPMLKALNLSPRLVEAARAAGCTNPAYASVGYREPSLVFLTRTEIRLTQPEGAAMFMDEPGEGCRIAFIEKAQEETFRAALPGKSAPVLLTRVRGVNINAALDKSRRLRVLDIAVYVRR